jgi:hypothetical protein
LQAKLPAILSPVDAEHYNAAAEAEIDSFTEDANETAAPAARNNRNKVSQLKRQERLSGKKGNANGNGTGNGSTATSPDESAANTELESADEEDVEAEAETNGAEDKKNKKKGLGKAGAARRRKMGMKK